MSAQTNLPGVPHAMTPLLMLREGSLFLFHYLYFNPYSSIVAFCGNKINMNVQIGSNFLLNQMMFVIKFPITGSILLATDGTMELVVRYVVENQAQ